MSSLTKTLYWVNHLRKLHGFEPLAEMPKGNHSGCGCPLFVALAPLDPGYVYSDGRLSRLHVPEEAADAFHDFVRAFDSGQYRDLVLPGSDDDL